MELFLIECQQYFKAQLSRLFLLGMGLFFALCAYLAFWVFATVLLASWWGLLASLLAVMGFHIVAALLLFITVLRMKPLSFAPATREEIKTDLICARLSSSKSSK